MVSQILLMPARHTHHRPSGSSEFASSSPAKSTNSTPRFFARDFEFNINIDCYSVRWRARSNAMITLMRATAGQVAQVIVPEGTSEGVRAQSTLHRS